MNALTKDKYPKDQNSFKSSGNVVSQKLFFFRKFVESQSTAFDYLNHVFSRIFDKSRETLIKTFKV